ncbi:hypothetical protein GCM10029976_086370 [Kribbella albertanoniae]|uniref:Uncharacterized protein n=1 Tax=Kribbella albertanoniae TaxID=1266829 RepID=A0A4R4P0Z2_9ACTN|nr:DUF6153 family protein [Kribbella albertanoniae]TDC14293.1 hypothetical protein E1261_43725 [Kribbella albertanoniae]
MTTRQAVRRGPARLLVAVLLLAGVFAMHALTGNHNPAMAEHTPAAHSMVASDTPAVEPVEDGHLHTMGEVCLAVLTALLIALVVTLVRRSFAPAHPIPPTGVVVPVILAEPSPPWRQPSLSKLCVLRT